MALHLIETTARRSVPPRLPASLVANPGAKWSVKLTVALAATMSVLLASCASSPVPVISDPPSASAVENEFASDVQSGPVMSNAPPVAFIDPAVVDPDAPTDYTVVRGDTLWDISGRFLTEPWRWPEIWNYNPQIADPNLIYPGDALALRYVNGSPTLTLTRADGSIQTRANGSMMNVSDGISDGNGGAGSGSNGTSGTGIDGRTKLSPRIRSESIDSAIPVIKSESIRPFLMHPRVVNDIKSLNGAPYTIADGDHRLMSSLGSKIYVRGPVNRDQPEYSVYRKNKPLIDPVSGANLGYEILHVSDAKLLNVGEVSTLGLISNKLETKAGDILLPMTIEADLPDFTPRMPALEGDARIVSLADAISQAGRDQVVVLNVGAQSSIESGDVLAIETRGRTIVDTVGGRRDRVQLPNERTGVLMVFQVFDKVSYALVMESTRPIKVNDIVTGI